MPSADEPMRFIVLDSGPAWLLTRRRGHPMGDRARAWLARLDQAGDRIILPAIAEYEVRRELLLRNATAALRRLDTLDVERLPMEPEDWEVAAMLWARARRAGIPTADRHALDADVIVAAQASLLAASAPEDQPVIVATTNEEHLNRLCEAEHWEKL
jgi:predicted nucleic acid-binding protein